MGVFSKNAQGITLLENIDPRACSAIKGFYNEKTGECILFKTEGEDTINITKIPVTKPFTSVSKKDVPKEFLEEPTED